MDFPRHYVFHSLTNTCPNEDNDGSDDDIKGAAKDAGATVEQASQNKDDDQVPLYYMELHPRVYSQFLWENRARACISFTVGSTARILSKWQLLILNVKLI